MRGIESGARTGSTLPRDPGTGSSKPIQMGCDTQEDFFPN